eukprot:CAMPEP_0181296752 /NCGR_PEP_ID=MMETSP1101-20121128/4870_1 /TAXON_ID=46948 /ORGANISM="Rhodomonas abbreviata, Strain Caron Lab Isolate" /LENGTH=150 /DNA_ID=CAMNT_0023401635 /DNA_START=41 /DNA_END=493 /DNA_ORIENTATION=-
MTDWFASRGDTFGDDSFGETLRDLLVACARGDRIPASFGGRVGGKLASSETTGAKQAKHLEYKLLGFEPLPEQLELVLESTVMLTSCPCAMRVSDASSFGDDFDDFEEEDEVLDGPASSAAVCASCFAFNDGERSISFIDTVRDPFLTAT